MKIKIFHLLLLTACLKFTLAQSIPDKYAEAMEAYNSSRFSEAVILFQEFSNSYSISDELFATARFYLAESYLNTGNKDAAAVGYKFLINNFKWSSFREKSLYKLGLINFDSKKYSASRKNFTAILDEYPSSEYIGSSLYWIGESYSEENRLTDAINFLEEAVNSRKNNKYIDYSIFTLATTYEKTGDYHNAVKYYDQLLSFHKNSPLAVNAQIRIGICYFKLEDYQSAILELQSPALSNLPEELYIECIYLLANAHYRVEEYPQAAEKFNELITLFPESDLRRDAEYGLAWSFFQQRLYNESYTTFDALSMGNDKISINSFYWKAESKRYAGYDKEATSLFKEFTLKYPDNELVSGAEYQMGGLSFTEKKLDVSLEYLRSAISSPDNIIRARAYTLLGEIELNKKQFDAAAKNFDYAIGIEGVTPDIQNRAKFGKGVVNFYNKNFTGAINLLLEVEQSDPQLEKDKLNFYLAESHYALDKYSDALTRYSFVDPQQEELAEQLLYGKAYSYFNLRQYENASFHFGDFVKKFSHSDLLTDAKLRLADSYYGSKNYSAASRIYKEVFSAGKDFSNDPYALYQYAQSLYKAGNTEEAITQFGNLQRNFHESEYAIGSLFTIGWIRFQQGRFTDAIAGYRNVFEVYPNSSLSPVLYYSIGDAYFNMGKYDSANVNYEKVLELYPSSDYVFDAVNGLQYSFVAQGKHERAITLISEFVNKNPRLSFSDQILFKKGEIYYSQREYENAKLSYKEFTSAYPNSKLIPDAYYWIGKSAQNLAQNDEAVLNFTKVFESYPSNEAAAASVIEIGNIHNSTKNYDAALGTYNRALDKLANSPRYAELLFMKGLTLVNKGDINEAYEVFDEVVQYYPGTIFSDKAKIEAGMIELSAKRFENAVTYFRSLAESRSDDLGANAQYLLGLTYFEQKNYTEAITSLVRVRTIFSSYEEWLTKSYLLLGDCYYEMKDLDKAREMFRTVLSKHRGDVFGQEAQNKLRAIQ
ncbi:MAG: tetratricopeptide repeat protein [Ignavibacteriales bacterium]|nr:MAG: tetratricopeptide repeat protein [Ignavibacteriales bacterium]